MDDTLHPALLPAGLGDLLPPEARVEADVVNALMATLQAHGYERVKPPLVEFEASLLGGPGAAMAQETFRMMDPISQRMIGVRADMTLQTARIATTRLVKSPRPLRLSYAGQVLRVRGSQLRPERQFGQVGAELIGSDAPEADAEVVLLAVEALSAIGVTGLSVDLTMPTLVPAVLRGLDVPERVAQAVRDALAHKDAAKVQALGGPVAQILSVLMTAAGPVEAGLAKLGTLQLTPEAMAELARLRDVALLIRSALPDLSLTIDPVENRGFEYHTGVSFTFFARNVRGELGRGGRYNAQPGGSADGAVVTLANPLIEPATGFTLYTDTAVRAAPEPKPTPKLYLPYGTPREAGAKLRAEGWITVMALSQGDAAQDAARLGCTHLYRDGSVAPLQGSN
ncbi:MAG TPA: ATP phosphoribosyltransferase regulatory subunit [Stellaceae bacterium]|jgi:ATP phosphoribosyltransferase regulatory subunit|nr:ATP phosphoribosyltransferase regulatory subunit [Stellaceae bacterium]